MSVEAFVTHSTPQADAVRSERAQATNALSAVRYASKPARVSGKAQPTNPKAASEFAAVMSLQEVPA